MSKKFENLPLLKDGYSLLSCDIDLESCNTNELDLIVEHIKYSMRSQDKMLCEAIAGARIHFNFDAWEWRRNNQLQELKEIEKFKKKLEKGNDNKKEVNKKEKISK
jgi:hypothetical protein